MFKFVSKGDNHHNESALFFNGQKIMTVDCYVYTDGEVIVNIKDGGDAVQADWKDWIEDWIED